MFIVLWLVILICRANDVIVPRLVSGVVGWMAIIEVALYIFAFLLTLVVGFITLKDE